MAITKLMEEAGLGEAEQFLLQLAAGLERPEIGSAFCFDATGCSRYQDQKAAESHDRHQRTYGPVHGAPPPTMVLGGG